jgi:hypothetical protein
MRASTAAGPMHDFYQALLAKGRKPTMALGPGAHSIDARLYGRKRIEIQND